MRRKYILFCLSFVSLLLTSCDIYRSDNGDLDGLWQMTTVENLTTGEVYDARDRQVTWGIQGALLELRASGARIVYAKFEHTGSSLVLREICFSGRGDSDWGDKPVQDPADIHVYGIYRLEEYFKVLELDSDVMRLESADVRLTFRKY